jgi:transposase
MRALDHEVVNVIFDTLEDLIPDRVEAHPLGCHRPRVPDRLCFRGLMIRLVTGSSWVDIEAILDHTVSDTTLRARRDEWINAGIFDRLFDQALDAFDRSIGLDLDNVAIDGSLHKAPCGGEGTGPSPVDRGKLGHKWSLAVEGQAIPLGWVLDGANRNDIPLLEPTLAVVAGRGLLSEVDTLHLDRGYDYPKIRRQLVAAGVAGFEIQKRGTKPALGQPHRLTLGLRWIVEASNSWLSNYGQLRRSTDRPIDRSIDRSTDRRIKHRHAAMCIASVVLIVGRLIDHRDRWSST